MGEYDEMCLEYFLANQSQLFDEKVAGNLEEAEEFLEDCMAVVCKNLKEVRAYFKEEGADIAQMSDDDLEDASEVFALPDGRYLVVEA
ncbi:glyoxalase [Lachnospiraceae bacterium 29-84]